MIGAWFVYGTALAALLALAARLSEEALAAWRLPTRWAWAGAALGSVLVPAALRWGTGGDVVGGTAPLVRSGAGGTAAGLDGLAASPPAPFPLSGTWPEALRSPEPFGPVLLALWGLGSLLVLAGAARAWWRVRRGRRRWPAARLDGCEVRVSPETGPAVSGLLDPVIVLPRRILRLPEAERRLVVRHEREHRRAGDPVLLTAGLAALAACPWNPVLWWIVRRLRLAVERDCDGRVLDDGADPETYGAVLLAEAGRRSTPLPAAALGQGRSCLERRIRAITSGTPRFRIVRSATAVVLAAGLLVVACDTPTPPRTGADAGPAEVEVRPDAASPSVRLSGRGEGTLRIVGTEPVDVTDPPLVLVDGEPVEGEDALEDLEPADIETIQVFKSQEAVRRYGEDARHGVVRITTTDGS